MKTGFFHALCLLLCAAAYPVGAAVYYTDNVKGSDANPGTPEQPFASIERGLAALATSDRLEVVNNPGKPYTRSYPGAEGVNYRIKSGGTAEAPLVVNGNGATLSGLVEIPPERWEKVSDTVYKLPFWPMSNFYRTEKRFDHWMPALKIWFVDGRDAVNALSREEMEKTPGSFWWSRAERKVYFRLPAGKTLEQLRIELPANSGFYTEADHCRIENFVFIYSWNDGFDTGNSPRNTIYKNCIAVNNCGQGFSCHGESLAIYEDCIAIRNGSAGSCNAHNSQASYIRCILADNVFEAGAFNYGTAVSRFYDSLIIDNRPAEQIWGHGNGGFLFSNCVIKAPDNRMPILFVRNGAVTMTRCTVTGGKYFNMLQPDALGTIILNECLIGGMKEFLFDLIPAHYRLSRNIYFDLPQFRLNGRNFPAADFAGYQAANSCDANSAYREKLPVNPATGVPDALRPTPGSRVGAILPPEVWRRYEKYKKARATPTGIVFD